MATMNLRNVPEDVRQKFKALCALRNTSMTAVIVEYMRREIQETDTALTWNFEDVETTDPDEK